MGPIGCPETSVGNYHCTLRNNPEERRSHLQRGGSRKYVHVRLGCSSMFCVDRKSLGFQVSRRLKGGPVQRNFRGAPVCGKSYSVGWNSCFSLVYIRLRGRFCWLPHCTELRLSGLNWTAIHSDMQKFRIIGFFSFENTLKLAVSSPAVTIYSMYLRLKLSTTPDLKS